MYATINVSVQGSLRETSYRAASSPICRCNEYLPPIFIPLQCLLYPVPLGPRVFRILLARPLLLLLDCFGKRIDLPLEGAMQTWRDSGTGSREERRALV